MTNTDYSGPTRILIKGILWSGSSAIYDYLKSFNEIEIISGRLPIPLKNNDFKRSEFTWFRKPGGIHDSISDYNRINIEHNFYFKTPITLLFLRNVFYSIKYSRTPSIKKNFEVISKHLKFKSLTINSIKSIKKLNKEESILEAKLWLDSVITLFNSSMKDFVLLDQPIDFGVHDEVYKGVFYPYKMIIVLRDLNDIISEIINSGHINNIYSYFDKYIYGFENRSPIYFLLDYFDAVLIALTNYLDDPDTLIVKFEDFVNDHSNVSIVVNEFLGLSKIPESFDYFDPKHSKNNIGLSNDFLSLDQIERINNLNKRINQIIFEHKKRYKY